jgi:hypothetical protein
VEYGASVGRSQCEYFLHASFSVDEVIGIGEELRDGNALDQGIEGLLRRQEEEQEEQDY